jgi:hypothetical protein
MHPLELISHLYGLALDALGIDPGEVNGAEIEIDESGWLATIVVQGMLVCLWDLYQTGNWEVYCTTDFPQESAGEDHAIL